MRRTGSALAACLCTAVLATAAAEDAAHFAITAITVDDQVLPAAAWSAALDHPEHPLELPACRSLRITWKQVLAGGARSCRLRHRLDGVDRTWQESVGRLRMTAAIVDRYQIPRASRMCLMSGDSPGWDGDPATAPLVDYDLQMTVPPGGESCDLSCTSEDAGGSLVGWGAVTAVTVTVQPADGSAPRRLRLERRPDAPTWVQVRTTAWWMAKPIPRRDGTDSLGLLDERNDAFATWRLQDRLQPAVAPGDAVHIAWQACHGLGRGGSETLAYGPLAPGAYLLRLGGREASGAVLPGESQLALRILPPWWERPGWWAGLAAGAVAAAALLARSLGQRRWRRQLAAAERRAALERERARIARDLHDELGANLAQISMLGSLARSAAGQAPELARQLDGIMARASEGSRKLRDIVWAVNPTNDAVEPLALFLCAVAEEHLRLAGVRFRVEIPEDLPAQPVTSAVRHNLVLAVREVLHNAVRHGRPGCVTLRMEVLAGELAVEIGDDGVGCDPAAAVAAGRGVAQLQERFRALGGTCRITGASGTGTTVRFSVPCLAAGRPDRG